MREYNSYSLPIYYTSLFPTSHKEEDPGTSEAFYTIGLADNGHHIGTSEYS